MSQQLISLYEIHVLVREIYYMYVGIDFLVENGICITLCTQSTLVN
jgi:hypothetical protein